MSAGLGSSPGLVAELDGAVLSIALNCPESGQVHDLATMPALERLLTAVAHDAAVRVVVLRGNGPDFGAGLETAAGMGAATSVGLALSKLAQPVIAMVHGRCHGAAMALIAFSDIVFAADDADWGGKQVQRDEVVTQTVPAAELQAQTYQLARELAAKDALALRFTKQTLQQVADLGWDEVLGFTSAKQAELTLLQGGQPSARATAVESFLAGKTKPGRG